MALTWLKDYNPRWDPKRRRLVIDFQGKTIGRDIYGISNCKWYRYNGTYRSATIDQQNIEERWFNHRFEDIRRHAETTVLTQDAFSAIKGKLAVPSMNFIALLGTTLTKALESSLLHSRPKMVYLMLDGDEAGQSASIRILRRLQLLGVPCKDVSPKQGDPKDYPKEWYIARLNHSESTV